MVCRRRRRAARRAASPAWWFLSVAAAAPLSAGAELQPDAEGLYDTAAVRWLQDWRDDDPVEVFYGEFLLAQWMLNTLPWNAYHSGLAFVNNRSGERALWDFAPMDTSSVMAIVVPQVVPPEEQPWKAFLGEYALEWRDEGRMNFFMYWPESYTTFTRVGRLSGAIFRRFARWARDEYRDRTSFSPIEVVVPGSGNLLRSQMCHDFSTDSLWALYREGVALKAEDLIFRDHVFFYASSVAASDDLPPRARRRRLRFLRALDLFMHRIRDEFTYVRVGFLSVWKLGLSMFVHAADGDFEAKLVPPFVNYCYLPLAMPPERYNPFASTKLCALALEANLTNTTAPLPWGPLIAVEDRLDRPEVFAALLLVVLAAALVTPSGAP